jgi:outer membrane protein assembly factor BamB
LKAAEAALRRALALLSDQPETAFYRAALSDGLANLLSRDNQPDAAAEAKSDADRMLKAAEAADPSTDIYSVMQSWIGPGPLDPMFLGPTAGAQALNDMAVRTGIYQQPFSFQLYMLHAQSTLRGKTEVPERLSYTLDHNRLDALSEFALSHDDQPLLAEITNQEQALISRMGSSNSRLDADRERSSLIGLLKAQGRVAEMNAVMADIAPQSLAADSNLALEIHAVRGDEMVLNGNADGAWAELQQGQALLKPLPFVDNSMFFVLEHAVAALRAHDFAGAEHLLEPFTVKDDYGSEHQSKVYRLVARSDFEQGRIEDAAQAIAHAIAATESDKSGQDEGPLGFGISENTRQLALSIDQAVTLALSPSCNLNFAEWAADAVLRVRGHQLALTAARFEELRHLPLGAETKLRDLQTVRARLAHELRDLGLEPDASPNWPVLDAVLDKENELQRGFSVQTLAQNKPPPDPNIKAVLGRLGNEAALLIYVIYRHYDADADALDLPKPSEPHMAAALLRAGSPVRWTDLGAVATIDGVVAKLRRTLNPQETTTTDLLVDTKAHLPDPIAVARMEDSAAQAVFGSWRTELAGLRRLVVAPDGNLSVLPFAALLSQDMQSIGPSLSEMATVADLTEGDETPEGRPAILADPDFDARAVAPLWSVAGLPPEPPRRTDARYPELRGTKKESEDVQAVLPDAVVFAGAQASKAALLGLHKPWILHIATHADFRLPRAGNASTTALLSTAGNPMLTSALVFAGANTREIGQDALATALELSNLDLEGTQLVVLSACDTGLGGVTAGEGVFGLRRAFAAAGARRIVLSLWKVDDAATSFLMGAFYKALKSGLDVDDALAHAQGETRRKPGWAQPYYWAGFILSGAHGRFSIELPKIPSRSTATTSDATLPLKGEVLWTYRTGGELYGAPALGAQMVFVGSKDGTLYALDRMTGALIWRFDTGSKLFDQPKLAGGHVFFGAENGMVYALDEASGRPGWQQKVAGSVYASPAVGNGVIYVAADHLSALSESTGEVIWSFDPLAITVPAPIGGAFYSKFGAEPSLDQEYLYIGDQAGRLYRLRRNDGQVVWTAPLGAGMVSKALLDGKRVIVATWKGSVAAFDRDTGVQLWRYEFKDEIDGQVALSDETIILGSHGFLPLTALNTLDGGVAWSIVTQVRGVWSLTAAGKQLLISSLNGLWLIDRSNGDIRRLVEGAVTAPSIIEDGTAYAGATDGTLYAIK